LLSLFLMQKNAVTATSSDLGFTENGLKELIFLPSRMSLFL